MTATIYNFDLEITDTDRLVYESVAWRLTRDLSKFEEYPCGWNLETP